MKIFKLVSSIILVMIIGLGCSTDDKLEIPNNDSSSNGESYGDIPPDVNVKINFSRILTDQIQGELSTSKSVSTYQLKYDLSTGFENPEEIELSEDSFTIENLDSATQYYFQARAKYNGNWSKWSDTKKVKTAYFSIKVGTFNVLADGAYLRNHGEVYPEEDWEYRREAFKSMVLENNPDVIGLQEMSQQSQIEDIIMDLEDDYDYHENNTEVDSRYIFWKKERFDFAGSEDDLDGFDETVLGLDNTRFISNVRLKEKKLEKMISIFNIHPQAGHTTERQKNRGMMAAKIVQTGREWYQQYETPIIVLGDFNNYRETVIDGFPSGPTVMERGGYYNTYDLAEDKINEGYASYTKIYDEVIDLNPNDSKRIDHIYVYPIDDIYVTEFKIDIRFGDDEHTIYSYPRPSDHNPVFSTLYLSY